MITLGQLGDAIAHAEAGQPNFIPPIEGYSSDKVRRLLSNLCSYPGVVYLEVGVHLGSTFIPAMYGNNAVGTCIDNWSLFGNLRPEFEKNLTRWLPGRDVTLIEGDVFKADLALIRQPVNVYFYDGSHDRTSQYAAFTYLDPILARRFIALVDDCNWEEPRDETLHAFRDLGYMVAWDKILPARYERDLDQWWNGLYVAYVEKTR